MHLQVPPGTQQNLKKILSRERYHSRLEIISTNNVFKYNAQYTIKLPNAEYKTTMIEDREWTRSRYAVADCPILSGRVITRGILGLDPIAPA